ncbi:MAG: hypothetical protein JST75_18550 [Bacteroidetes bacterium]|nr:hypothetical protein [Bacteroidota bacterium]
MRRLLTIFLLLIVTFNWFGYRLVAAFMEDRANDKMEHLLDNENYDQAQLISISIQAHDLSYASNDLNFKRVNGRVEINRVQYSFVKWRVYDGVLELLCLPNMIATKLEKTNVDIFKLISDLQNEGQNKKSSPLSNIAKNLSAEYYIESDALTFVICFKNLKGRYHLSSDIPMNFSSPIDYPPEYHC